MSHKLLKVLVLDTENIIFEGEADRVSSFNEVGRFDVYPMHANFISIVKQELALYMKGKKIKELKLEQAVMKVKQDEVNIFLGIDVLIVDDNLTQPSPSDQQAAKTTK
jgi:F0F1-type ATP synthase epsilon subunit